MTGRPYPTPYCFSIITAIVPESDLEKAFPSRPQTSLVTCTAEDLHSLAACFLQSNSSTHFSPNALPGWVRREVNLIQALKIRDSRLVHPAPCHDSS